MTNKNWLRCSVGAAILAMQLAAPFALGQEDPTAKKLQEFEERLRRLEEQQQRPKSADDAQKPQVEGKKTVEVEELRRQLDVLAQELEKLRSGEEDVEISARQARSLGVGPSAAAVYRKKQGVSLAGYGEMLYQNFDSRDQSGREVGQGAQLDFVRAILYAGYRFNDKFLFNSEIEFEHGSTEEGGAVSVEFAYIDYLASEHFSLRGGLLLIPMGLVNEFHEPNAFIGARRPETEQRIIPSTWRENGFGLTGSAGIFDYRAYLVNGLNAEGFSSDGLRGGRQQGAEARASDLAFVGRLDIHPSPGMFFGASVFRGGSGQGQFEFEGRKLDVTTTISEVHGQVQLRGFDLRGLYAQAAVDDAGELSRLMELAPDRPIAERMQGGYLQFGYNLLTRVNDRAILMPFYRFEKLDTQDEVPIGFFDDLSSDRTFHTFGLEYKPIRNIVLKGDFQWIRNAAASGVNQFNLALGYSF